MNYLDVYFSRINYFGETEAERIKNSGMVQFEKWMATSPFTVLDLSVERGIYFSGIIQTSKDKEEQKLMYLYVANDIPIKVGDILTWRQDDGQVEKWLLLQKIHKVHGTYQTFQIIKCNYELKWIDTDGYLRKSWAYAVSSVDSKVKGNFRMWHSLISPQPNKFAEIIMPRPIFRENSADYDELMRGVTFIIENEGWVVIECDWTSVEGIVYMSLTESKVNYQYDDRKLDVADTDRYKFPELPTIYHVGDIIVPQFEEGTLNQWEIELLKPEGSDFIDANTWQAIGEGQCMITMRLKNRPAITKQVEITVRSNEASEPQYNIIGDASLRLDRQGVYEIVTNVSPIPKINLVIETSPAPGKDQIKAALDDNNEIIQNKFILHANAVNKIGPIKLAAQLQDGTVVATKTVQVIPLW